MRPPRYLPHWELPKLPYSPGDGDRPGPISDPQGEGAGSSDRQFLRGADLFNHGFYWRAHEAWEELWLASTKGGERAALKGLIQCCASLLHLDKGHNVDALSERALAHLRASTGHTLPFDSSVFISEWEAYLVDPQDTNRPWVQL